MLYNRLEHLGTSSCPELASGENLEEIMVSEIENAKTKYWELFKKWLEEKELKTSGSQSTDSEENFIFTDWKQSFGYPLEKIN